MIGNTTKPSIDTQKNSRLVSSEICMGMVAGISVLILIASSIMSISVYFNSVGDANMFTSTEFIVFLTGATTALLLVSIAMWILIIKMRSEEQKSMTKTLEDDEKTVPTAEEEIVFEEDDYCEIVWEYSHDPS